ncbi:MAG: hypothetical protein WC998_07020 [Candidatus Paceibacterota bacterium]
MVVQYVPALGTGGSSAKIALVAASSMTFTVDGAAPAGLDAIGTTGVILTSTAAYDTMGELCDYIDGRRAWRAYLVAALRADLSSTLLAKTAADAMTATGLTFYGDTSTATTTGTQTIGVAISGEQFVNTSIAGHVKDADDKVLNILNYASVTLTFTGTAGATNNVQVHSGKQGSTETQLIKKTIATTVNTELGAGYPMTGYLQSIPGERLIVRANVGTAFSAYTVFQVVGRSAVLKGNRIVNTVNYTAG